MDHESPAPNENLEIAVASLTADFDDAVAFRCQASSVCEELRLETEYKVTLTFFETQLRRVHTRFRFRFTENWVVRINQSTCVEFKEFSRTIESLLSSIQTATKSLANLNGKNKFVDIMAAFENAQSAIQTSLNEFEAALANVTKKYCSAWKEDDENT